jgi:hypothetical protein
VARLAVTEGGSQGDQNPLLCPNHRDAEGEGGTAEALLGVPCRVRYPPGEGLPGLVRPLSGHAAGADDGGKQVGGQGLGIGVGQDHAAHDHVF